MRLLTTIIIISFSLLTSATTFADTCKPVYNDKPFAAARIQELSGVYCEYGAPAPKGNVNYRLRGNFRPASGPWKFLTPPEIEFQAVCESTDSAVCQFKSGN